MKNMNTIEISVPENFEAFKEMFHVKHFCSQLSQWDIHLSDLQLEQFYLYYKELVQWNAVMNLTTIIELPDVLTKHFLDSLSIVLICSKSRLDEGLSVIDVGTGAGFPGIPIAIAFPKASIVLMDSLAKRVRFLETVTGRLGLKNCSSVHSRAEDLARNHEYREKFDIATARAVADLKVLCEYDLPFVKPGGEFIAYKSGKIEEELAGTEHAIRVLGGKKEQVITFALPETDYSRTLLSIRKLHATSQKYPRKAGLPSREPIQL